MKRAIAFFSILGAGVSLHARAASPVARVQVIPLPGVEGRIDHMTADPAHQRLYLAALGHDTVEVIDLAAGRRIHTLLGLHEPQGIGYAPSSRRCFVANGSSGTCMVYDASSYKKLGSILLGDDADNVRYDGKTDRVYVGYGRGGIVILEAAGLHRLGTIPLSGHPESFQLEKRSSRIFVNIPSTGQIAVLDRTRKTVLASWPVEGARSNFPMALDEAHHRLFVGCRAPARLLVYDTSSGKVTAFLPIAGDTDDLFYDARHQRVYVSGGEGYLDVIDQESPDRYARVMHLPTAPGARTSLFVPELSRLYVAVPHRGNQSAVLQVFSTASPSDRTR